MKLELFDTYSIRVRISNGIILLSPIAITVFLCFEELTSILTSSIFLSLLLAFTNYLPLLQRRICNNSFSDTNYAFILLGPNDKTIDEVTKKRYYRKLANTDPSFLQLQAPTNDETFSEACNSAIIFLRRRTRNNRLVQEENINYGFCKNLLANKYLGIVSCAILIISICLYSWIKFNVFSSIPLKIYFSLSINIVMLIFWIFGITQNMLKNAAKEYAQTLLGAIDTL